MDIIWAPWRMEYIMGEKEKECLFCRLARERKDRKNYLLFRGKKCFILLNIFPYNNGHVMISPNRHIKDLKALTDRENNDIFKTLKQVIYLLDKVLRPQGYNVGMNIGKCSGAGVPGHLQRRCVPDPLSGVQRPGGSLV